MHASAFTQQVQNSIALAAPEHRQFGGMPFEKELKLQETGKTAFWHIASHEGHGKAALWFAKIRGEAHLKEISPLKWWYTYHG